MEEKERARRVAEREEERKRESELNGATRGRVSILECTCRRNRTRTASEPRKREREKERGRERETLYTPVNVVVVASGKGQQPRCGRSFYLLLFKARVSAAHAVLCKLRQGPDQTCRSDGYARNAPKLAKVEQTVRIVSRQIERKKRGT